MKIRFLGTGSSAGSPVIGCDCSVCCSPDARNRRSRASIAIEEGETRVLVDTGPDLRQQALAADYRFLTAVLYTHFHADHINGIDDLRAFNFLQKGVIPCYADPRTAKELEARFNYCFLPPDAAWAKPSLSMSIMPTELSLGTLRIHPIPVQHGKLPIYGYRFNDVAYLTDLKTISEESLALLTGLEVLILDCLRDAHHPTHLSVQEAIALALKIGARQTWFTHMTHELEYSQLAARLPEGIRPAYDGLELEVS